MKNIFLIVLFLAIIFNTYSQNCGIYNSATDYKNSNFSNQGSKILVDLFFKPNYVKLKTNDNSIYFNKDSIWGVKNENSIFRFYNSKKYELVENEEIFIYKTFVQARIKADRIKYFYSQNPESEILPLTIENLENSFSTNTKFIDLLHVSILKDENLYDFDKHCNNLRITNLFILSNKQ
ncbi:MAG: hypothetical protein ACM3PT_01845 [Deltaproteobacteria bacterium]